jgi:hypothetical protein
MLLGCPYLPKSGVVVLLPRPMRPALCSKGSTSGLSHQAYPTMRRPTSVRQAACCVYHGGSQPRAVVPSALGTVAPSPSCTSRLPYPPGRVGSVWVSSFPPLGDRGMSTVPTGLPAILR